MANRSRLENRGGIVGPGVIGETWLFRSLFGVVVSGYEDSGEIGGMARPARIGVLGLLKSWLSRGEA